MPTQTPVEALVSAYVFAASGARTGYSLDGVVTTNATSDGQRQSASSSSSGSSQIYAPQESIIRSGGTMQVLSRAGGTGEARTDPQTLYSSVYTRSLKTRVSTSTLDTFPASTTQQTPRLGGNTVPKAFSSHSSPSHLNSEASSLTTMPLSPQQNTASDKMVVAFQTHLTTTLSIPTATTPLDDESLSKKLSRSPESQHHGDQDKPGAQWPAPLPTPETRGPPRPYQTHLRPEPSSLRPHCTAAQRLVLWKPLNRRTFCDLNGRTLNVSEDDIQRVHLVLAASWAEGTMESYAAGLLVFHVFCDHRGIPEDQRAPASPDLIGLWISHLAGSYSGGAVRNYVSGVRAWHIIHGVEWRINKPQLDTLLRSSERLRPLESRRKKRQPFTVQFIEALLSQLDLNDPFDASTASCLTTTFFGAARVAEFTVPRLESFDPVKHVTRAGMRTGRDRNGFETTIFRVPCTKGEPFNGEDVYWAAQNGPSNPQPLLENHFRVNDPPQNSHLFAYKFKQNGKVILRPLTKPAFIKRLTSAAKAAGLEPLQGHGIRIGSTLEYLLRGLPFEVVKVLGRWKSDAFLVYLRKHAEIMAPYMQPELHQALIAYTMPPVR